MNVSGRSNFVGPNFLSFSEFEQTVLRILTRIFGQGGHNRILRAQMKFFFNFWRREMKEKILLFEKFALLSFSDFERKRSFVLLQAWLRQACQKFVDMFRRRFLQINFLEGLLYFPHFRKSSKNFSEFWRQNFGRVVTTTFIHVHRKIFRKVIFLSKSSMFFFVVFGIWAPNVWTLRENYLLPLSRLHSPLLKNHFWWKNQFCSKNCNFNVFVVRESFSFFGNKVTPGLPKLHCAC